MKRYYVIRGREGREEDLYSKIKLNKEGDDFILSRIYLYSYKSALKFLHRYNNLDSITYQINKYRFVVYDPMLPHFNFYYEIREEEINFFKKKNKLKEMHFGSPGAGFHVDLNKR